MVLFTEVKGQMGDKTVSQHCNPRDSKPGNKKKKNNLLF